VVEYNFIKSDFKYSAIAQKLGIDVGGKTLPAVKKEVVDYVTNFRKSVGIDSTLGTKGVSMGLISVLSDKAIKDPCNATNPRVPSKADLAAIYSEAI
jgi:alcohol dehydrogenase class IV